jgi:hypothetical protein
MVSAVTASAAKKDTGTTTLKDVQPAGTTDTKEKKKQQYDFIFEASGNHYTCRTSPKTSVKAVDFVVGSDVKYEVDGEKGGAQVYLYRRDRGQAVKSITRDARKNHHQRDMSQIGLLDLRFLPRLN